MMIDSVVCTQYINVTDRHTDSHVATANAAPTQYASGGKNQHGWTQRKLLLFEMSEDTTLSGKLFQIFGTATGNALLPTVCKPEQRAQPGGR